LMIPRPSGRAVLALAGHPIALVGQDDFLRSHPNHPQQPVPPPWTRDVGGNGYRSCSRLAVVVNRNGFTFVWDRKSASGCFPVARPLDDSDFHGLISYMCVRTDTGIPACSSIHPSFKIHSSKDSHHPSSPSLLIRPTHLNPVISARA
jgi:hypothetical protein